MTALADNTFMLDGVEYVRNDTEPRTAAFHIAIDYAKAGAFVGEFKRDGRLTFVAMERKSGSAWLVLTPTEGEYWVSFVDADGTTVGRGSYFDSLLLDEPDLHDFLGWL